MNHSILCPTDFSEQGAQALRYAAELAHQRHAKLIVAHVARRRNGEWTAPEQASYEDSFLSRASSDKPVDAELTPPGSVAQREQIRSMLREALRNEDFPCEFVVVEGEPAEQIVELARLQHVEQIVMGTRGTQGFHEVRLGSTAQDVVDHAPCPVTVVRNEGVDPRS